VCGVVAVSMSTAAVCVRSVAPGVPADVLVVVIGYCTAAFPVRAPGRLIIVIGRP
jgi:hypothetical protein